MSKSFAVFDIDGTLIRWQLYHVVVDKLVKAGAITPEAFRVVREARMAWKRREHPEAFKAYEHELITVYEAALEHLSTKTFDAIVLDVIDEYKDQTYTYTRDLLRELKAKGYLLFIISGSHEELIEQIGKYYGFDDWLGTRYLRTGEHFSGQKFVASKDKRAGLQTLIEKHGVSMQNSMAVGDSTSDIAMLEMVEQPIVFNPDRLLFETARQRGWQIVIERKNVVYELRPHDGSYLLVEAGQ
jgi:HAD superfamily hydrolase (TIGR01490 family)